METEANESILDMETEKQRNRETEKQKSPRQGEERENCFVLRATAGSVETRNSYYKFYYTSYKLLVLIYKL